MAAGKRPGEARAGHNRRPSWRGLGQRLSRTSQPGDIAVPIRAEFRVLYPPNWADLSQRIRFERAGGRCQGCGRPHLARVRCLPDGRWFDEAKRTWRDRRGRPARWPDLIDAVDLRLTRVVLAAAHMDNNPANNRLSNLRGLCQRCHMLHDRPFHLAQRWLTYRRRWAIGDLFLGRYGVFALRIEADLKYGKPGSGVPRAASRSAARGSAGDLFASTR
jgi:hypothetical protein